jgi:cellobiose phosphorylase
MTPGFYENGSVYVHGNCFWLYALAVAGRGGEAWDAIRDILPDTPNKPNTDTEPFVIPNYYIGPNVERRKQRNLFLSGWRTGSAAWVYFTCLEEILGLRAEYDGLAIDPHLPEGWANVSATRPFRGDTYEVTIESTGRTGATVRQITLDGESVDGSVIPPVGDGQLHKVHVTLG